MEPEIKGSPTEETDSADVVVVGQPPPLMADRILWHLCIQARSRVLDCLEEACAASAEEEASRLEEEAEVLEWKMNRALNPVCEVPAAILARFDEYTEHPDYPVPRWCKLEPHAG